jgi:tRNA (cmo5U34)-methyltransferase
MDRTPVADVAESFDTGGWEFNAAVVDQFPEHVRASVPFYEQIQGLVAEVSDWYLPSGGVLADLGASTGVTVGQVLRRHPDRVITAHLYDQQPLMLERAQKSLATVIGTRRAWYHCQRIQEPLAHTDADLTVCLFTLQFLPLADRVEALRLARQAAAGTGVLLVAEKIRPTDSRWAEIANDVSHDYKSVHGIADSAIRAKARALRGVLIPYPEYTLRNVITEAGWQAPEVLFRWHSWVVMGAFATG